jgi:small subunit ribosomal protein S7
MVKNLSHSRIFYDALDIVEAKKGDNEKSSLEIWKDALLM